MVVAVHIVTIHACQIEAFATLGRILPIGLNRREGPRAASQVALVLKHQKSVLLNLLLLAQFELDNPLYQFRILIFFLLVQVFHFAHFSSHVDMIIGSNLVLQISDTFTLTDDGSLFSAILLGLVHVLFFCESDIFHQLFEFNRVCICVLQFYQLTTLDILLLLQHS